MPHIPPALEQFQNALEKRTQAIERKAQRLRSPATKASQKGRKPTQLVNPLIGFDELRAYPPWADDILQGAARANSYRPGARSIPLSTKQMVRILLHLPVIDTVSITQLLLLEERQARRYVQALRLAMPYLIRSMPPALANRPSGNDDCVDDFGPQPGLMA